MAIVMTAEIPASADMYDALNKEMGMSEGNLPKGMIAHYAAPTDNGMLIFDIWESKEQFEVFGQTLVPILAGLGIGLTAFVVWLATGMRGVQSRTDETQRTDDSGAPAHRGDRDGIRGDAAPEARA